MSTSELEAQVLLLVRLHLYAQAAEHAVVYREQFRVIRERIVREGPGSSPRGSFPSVFWGAFWDEVQRRRGAGETVVI